MNNQVNAILIALGIVLLLSLASVYGQANAKKMGMMGNDNMMNMMGGNMGDMMKGMDMDKMNEHMKECSEAMASGDPEKMMEMMKKHMSDGHMNGMMGGSGMSQEEHESHHK